MHTQIVNEPLQVSGVKEFNDITYIYLDKLITLLGFYYCSTFYIHWQPAVLLKLTWTRRDRPIPSYIINQNEIKRSSLCQIELCLSVCLGSRKSAEAAVIALLSSSKARLMQSFHNPVWRKSQILSVSNFQGGA